MKPIGENAPENPYPLQALLDLYARAYALERGNSEEYPRTVDPSSDQQGTYESTLELYQSLLPRLQGLSLEEWSMSPREWGYEPRPLEMMFVHQLTLLYEFVSHHIIEGLTIHHDQALDEAFKGATADVCKATLADGREVAAKIYKLKNVLSIASAATEALCVKIVTEAGALDPPINFGANFHGIHVAKDGKMALIMDIAPGHSIEWDQLSGPVPEGEDGADFINAHSYVTLADKMERLHTATGLTFGFDSGQMYIGEDGEVFFIDMDKLLPIQSHEQEIENARGAYAEKMESLMHFDREI